MKLRFGLLFTLLLHFVFTPLIAEKITGESAKIRVLIEKDLIEATLEIEGAYKIVNLEQKTNVAKSFFAKRAQLKGSSKGIIWGDLLQGAHQIEVIPNNPATTILVNGIQYCGKLKIYNYKNQIQIINIVDVEDYLNASISTEFGSTNYPLKTLESLSIIMRTNLYHMIWKNQNPYWDIESNKTKFLGPSAISSNSLIGQAVDGTKHLILVFENQPFRTDWTENCGGKTAKFETIYRKKCKGPDGVFSAIAQKERESNRWKCSLSTTELTHMLDFEKIEGAELFSDPTSKKVYAIKFHGGKKTTKISFFEFQSMLGKERLQSSDFTIHLFKDHILIDGYGKGPGVGLCLYSATQMAKLGDNITNILYHFYPGTSLVKLDHFQKSLFKRPSKEEIAIE